MTAPTAEDVIAEAWLLGKRGVPLKPTGRDLKAAAAVVAVIRAMTVEQQAELIGGYVRQATATGVMRGDRFVPSVRVVGPWRAEP